jgi:hypothetical protein
MWVSVVMQDSDALHIRSLFLHSIANSVQLVCVQCSGDRLVGIQQLKVYQSFAVPPKAQHNLLSMNFGHWGRNCMFSGAQPLLLVRGVVKRNPFHI